MKENNILIIDDDLTLLKTAEEILSEQYNVSVAKSGIQALNLLKRNIIPDLILLDIDMPHIDGYETLEEIKKKLTPTEWKVALAIAEGMENKEIAESLHYSYGYVKNLIARIFAKLNIEKRRELKKMINNLIH